MICLFCLSCSLFSQSISDSLLCKFSNQTLSIFFEDSVGIKQQGKFKDVLIRTGFDTNCLIKGKKDLEFLYLPEDEDIDYSKYIMKLKKNTEERRMLYTLSHKVISIDTVDVIISTAYIYRNSKNGFNISVSSGGTMGYIPQGRFVFDGITNEWDFVSGKQIMEEKAKKEDEFLKNLIEENKKRNP